MLIQNIELLVAVLQAYSKQGKVFRVFESTLFGTNERLIGASMLYAQVRDYKELVLGFEITQEHIRVSMVGSQGIRIEIKDVK